MQQWEYKLIGYAQGKVISIDGNIVGKVTGTGLTWVANSKYVGQGRTYSSCLSGSAQKDGKRLVSVTLTCFSSVLLRE
jgi:hypothetical protein